MDEARGDAVRLAVRPQLIHPLRDKGALIVIVNGQLLLVDALTFCIFRKARHAAIQAQRQQLIAVGRVIDAREAVFLRKFLIGQPGLLLIRAHHAHAGLAPRLRVGNAVFHQLPPIAVTLQIAQHPQAINI